MAAGPDALDDLLAEIASFAEAHGMIKADFQQQIVLAEVDAVARNAGFEPQQIAHATIGEHRQDRENREGDQQFEQGEASATPQSWFSVFHVPASC